MRGTINGGHIRTLGIGAWNGAHMRMGVYHLWLDSTDAILAPIASPLWGWRIGQRVEGGGRRAGADGAFNMT